MSRNTIYRSAALAVATLALSACAEPSVPTSPLDRAGTAANAVADLAAEPTSIEWQAEARRLVGVHNMSALAAARVYAALGVAQYQAVMAATTLPSGGELSTSGIGAGGRDALEANRGAVAGASANVLSFLFPNFAQVQEQRVLAIAEAGPGSVHSEFERGLALGRAAGSAMVERLKADKFTTPWTVPYPQVRESGSPTVHPQGRRSAA